VESIRLVYLDRIGERVKFYWGPGTSVRVVRDGIHVLQADGVIVGIWPDRYVPLQIRIDRDHQLGRNVQWTGIFFWDEIAI
jgi:hypothetical protein